MFGDGFIEQLDSSFQRGDRGRRVAGTHIELNGRESQTKVLGPFVERSQYRLQGLRARLPMRMSGSVVYR